MGAVLIVGGAPVASDFSYFLERLKHVGIQDLMAEGAIEAFDVGILIRLAGLDVVKVHSLVSASGGQHVGQILGAVIDADRVRFAPPFH